MNVSPWDYTLRELVWLAEGAREESWARVAWLCAVIVNAQTGKRTDAKDYNPLERAKRKVHMAFMAAWIKEQGAKLPTSLSEDAIELRWQEYLEQCKDLAESAQGQ